MFGNYSFIGVNRSIRKKNNLNNLLFSFKVQFNSCFIRVNYSTVNKNNNIQSNTPLNDKPNISNKVINFDNKIDSFDDKIKFLLYNNNEITINDLNLSNSQIDHFFLKLINDYKINFNDTSIIGINRLIKLLPYNSKYGDEIIKNCGILDSDQILDTFKFKYNDILRILTIDILIERKLYNDAFEFMKVYESLPNFNKSKLIKWKLKLLKFNEFQEKISINCNDLVNSNLIHVYLRELLKNGNYTTSQKFEYYLIIIFKTFALNKDLTQNQIHTFNTTFLTLLLKQDGISYNVFLAYFISLFPNSKELLISLHLLDNERLQNLPVVNIRKECIQNDYPYILDLGLLYNKYLNSIKPHKSSFKLLFKTYLKQVQKHQLNNTGNSIKHPFDKNFHDTTILTQFLGYILKRDFPKPILSTNIIIKCYKNLKFSNIDFYRLTNHPNHKNMLSSLFNFLINIDHIYSNISIGLDIMKLLSDLNIYLNGNCYLNLINSLARLDFPTDAEKVYFWILENNQITCQLNRDEVLKIARQNKFPAPKDDVLFLDDLTKANKIFTYNKDYLLKSLSPKELIDELDNQLNNVN